LTVIIGGLRFAISLPSPTISALHSRRCLPGRDDPDLVPPANSDEIQNSAGVCRADPTRPSFSFDGVRRGAQPARVEVGLLGLVGLETMLANVIGVAIDDVPIEQQASPCMSLP
jgi:hypothetical protein